MNQDETSAGNETGFLNLNLILGFLLLLAPSLVLLSCQADSAAACANEGPCMLYFYIDDWVVCKQMDPIVHGLEERYGQDIKIVRLDVAESQGKKIAREYGCIGQPSFVFFNRAGELFQRLIGAQSTETFEKVIEQILE